MLTSTTANRNDQLAPPAKAEWEDPAITLERELEVRAQGGPSGNSGPVPGAIGPFGDSGLGGSCPPPTDGP